MYWKETRDKEQNIIALSANVEDITINLSANASDNGNWCLRATPLSLTHTMFLNTTDMETAKENAKAIILERLERLTEEIGALKASLESGVNVHIQ